MKTKTSSNASAIEKKSMHISCKWFASYCIILYSRSFNRRLIPNVWAFIRRRNITAFGTRHYNWLSKKLLFPSIQNPTQKYINNNIERNRINWPRPLQHDSMTSLTWSSGVQLSLSRGEYFPFHRRWHQGFFSWIMRRPFTFFRSRTWRRKRWDWKKV